MLLLQVTECRQVSEHLVGWVEHSLLVWVLLQILNVLSSNVLIIIIVGLRKLAVLTRVGL